MEVSTLGRLLLALGLGLALLGGLLLAAARVPGLDRLGRLPGDFSFERGPVTIAVPLATSLLISLVLTIALNLFLRR